MSDDLLFITFKLKIIIDENCVIMRVKRGNYATSKKIKSVIAPSSLIELLKRMLRAEF